MKFEFTFDAVSLDAEKECSYRKIQDMAYAGIAAPEDEAAWKMTRQKSIYRTIFKDKWLIVCRLSKWQETVFTEILPVTL